MKHPTPQIEASRISAMTAKQAGDTLKGYLNKKGAEYVRSILYKLQDYDRKRNGQNDSWWLEMMHEAGEDVSKLF